MIEKQKAMEKNKKNLWKILLLPIALLGVICAATYRIEKAKFSPFEEEFANDSKKGCEKKDDLRKEWCISSFFFNNKSLYNKLFIILCCFNVKLFMTEFSCGYKSTKLYCWKGEKNLWKK